MVILARFSRMGRPKKGKTKKQKEKERKAREKEKRLRRKEERANSAKNAVSNDRDLAQNPQFQGNSVPKFMTKIQPDAASVTIPVTEESHGPAIQLIPFSNVKI